MCNKIRPLVGTRKDNRFARSSSGSGISTELCLSMTLRYLAGGSVLDIIDMHGVAYGTFYNLVWRTIEAVNASLRLPGLPLNDLDALEELSEGFSDLNKGSLVGCVGAIDGIAIRINKPSLWDTVFPKQFMNRKSFFSINCQAICDSQLRFTWASLKSPGGTHDSLAWRCTDLYAKLNDNALPSPYFLVGDDAYGCKNWMITPFPSRGLTQAKSDFNFYQSKTRITIERAFGVLVSRWGILRRALTCSLRHSVALVRCCMRLHNFCIDEGMPDVEPIRSGKEREVRQGVDRFRPYRQSADSLMDPLSPTERARKTRESNDSRRKELFQDVHRLGLRRPATSTHGQGLRRAGSRIRRARA